MEVDAYLNPQDVAERTATEVREGYLGLARTADEAGFDGILAGQHYLSHFTQLQLVPFLSRLTGEVDVDVLGTGVALLPFHHPVDLAERVATVDALHDGHTVFGVGAGYRDVEFAAFGVPKSERVSRTVECLECATRLLSEADVTYEGEHFAVEDATIPVRPDPEDLSVWMAANADPAVERAARTTDAWFVNPHATMSEIREQKESIYDPAREERGEPTGVPVFREAFVAPTRSEAVDAVEDHLWEKYQAYIDWGQDEAMEDETDLHRPFDELAEDRFVLGTPADVLAAIERYETELNASRVVLRCHWPGLPYERTRECLELLGDEVLPYV